MNVFVTITAKHMDSLAGNATFKTNVMFTNK